MKRLIPLILPALALAGCQSEKPAQRSQTPSFYVSMASADARVDAAMARDMIGAYRGNNGLRPLTLDPDLQAAAQAAADAMARADKPGSAEAFKARLVSGGFTAPAANISAGYHTLAEAFSGWRESPQHNRVLLDTRATRIGIATAYTPNSKYKVYWVMAVAADKR
ncbi:CAP domain-containing protein [Microvirga mediterraneensis]|uniref:CAP domain-containing protein n=1 Tax=Microvirga mediterraneensis TaxID=2754695 RepID=A0A838BI41_9HYPH|nr:CAP domain-containing protein [Microvirga mediterraneensis]MBA1154901.1 CAP domain-containing protein [Microvirga mediterraneensis]